MPIGVGIGEAFGNLTLRCNPGNPLRVRRQALAGKQDVPDAAHHGAEYVEAQVLCAGHVPVSQVGARKGLAVVVSFLPVITPEPSSGSPDVADSILERPCCDHVLASHGPFCSDTSLT